MTDVTDTYGGNSPSRLDRIEALLERSIQQHHQEMAEIRAGLRETRSIADSNARSVQAWETRFAEIEAETQAATSSTRADLSQRIDSQSERIERVERQSEDD